MQSRSSPLDDVTHKCRNELYFTVLSCDCKITLYLSLFSLGIRENQYGINAWEACKTVQYNTAAKNESSFTKVKTKHNTQNLP